MHTQINNHAHTYTNSRTHAHSVLEAQEKAQSLLEKKGLGDKKVLRLILEKDGTELDPDEKIAVWVTGMDIF
jgi:hypothetical protein